MQQLNTKDVQKKFGVSPMTVTNWRKGSTRISALPYHTEAAGTRSRIYFLESEVDTWAESNDIKPVRG